MKFLQLFFTSVFLCFMFSCSDPCDDVSCGDNGTCDDGTCICDTGYEGTLCDTKIIDKYTGSWVSSDFGCDGTVQDNVVLVIQQGDTVTDIVFYDPEEPEFLYTITYNDSILTVPSQFVNGVTISGSGTLNEDGIMDLTFDLIGEENDMFVCAGSFTKQ